jgi:cholera toxin transcriptional activator
LREALGDKANQPTFVETLARRGYRFLAPVERIVPEAKDPKLQSSDSVLALVTEKEVALPGSEEMGLMDRLLATPEDLPPGSHNVAHVLFLLLQVMYLSFSIGALANLPEINELLSPLPSASTVFTALILTAALLIPVRIFLLCAVLFRAPRLGQTFRRLWWLLLPLDALWSLSPFLLLHHINYGVALACTTILLYSPFAQRSLILMGAGRRLPST